MIPFLATPSSADEVAEPDPPAADTTVVMVASRIDQDLAGRISDAVAAQLGDLPVALELAWVDSLRPDLRSQVEHARSAASREEATIVFWFDLSATAQVYLYLDEPGGGRILVRDIHVDGENQEGRIETLGVIVRSAVGAILEGNTVGVEAPPSPPPPPPPEPPYEVLGARLSYGAGLYAPEALVMHGGRLGISVGLARWARLFLAYRALFPLTVAGEHLDLEVRPHPAELGLGYRWSSAGWSLEAGLAAVVDLTTFNVRSDGSGVRTTDPGPRWLFALAPTLGASRHLFWKLAAFLQISVDFVINENVYAIQTEVGSETVLEPWWARPMVQLGLSVSLM